MKKRQLLPLVMCFLLFSAILGSFSPNAKAQEGGINQDMNKWAVNGTCVVRLPNGTVTTYPAKDCVSYLYYYCHTTNPCTNTVPE